MMNDYYLIPFGQNVIMVMVCNLQYITRIAFLNTQRYFNVIISVNAYKSDVTKLLEKCEKVFLLETKY